MACWEHPYQYFIHYIFQGNKRGLKNKEDEQSQYHGLYLVIGTKWQFPYTLVAKKGLLIKYNNHKSGGYEMKKLIYCSIVFLLCQIVTVSHAYTISNLTSEIADPIGSAQASFDESSGSVMTYAEAGFNGFDFGYYSSASVRVSGRLHVEYGQEVYLDFTHAGEVIASGENSFASGYFHFEMEGISITSQMLADSFSGADSQFYYSSANGETHYLLSYSDANKHWFTIPYATEAWDFSYTMSSVAEVLSYDPYNPSVSLSRLRA